MNEPALGAFTLGNEEFVRENWSKALEFFKHASELDPTKAEYFLHQAAALTKMGNFDEAVEACDAAMAIDPKNAKVYLRKGMALVQKGDLVTAQQVLTQGTRIDPANKSFACWLNKCTDTGSAPAAAVANCQLGQHDSELTSLFSAHGEQVYPLLETVLEFLKRRTDFFDRGALATNMIGDLAHKYAHGTKPKSNSAAAAAPPQQEMESDELRDMPVLVSPSAKQALEKAIQQRNEQNSGEEGGEGSIKVGTQCKNNSCTKVYQGPESVDQVCLYHPGAPVFHEGYKYWSCCKKKKTTDFSEFLSFTGCTQGTCVFVDDPTKKKKALCRYDFFQQGPTVTVSVYAKKVHPEQCEFKISPTRLKLSIVFDFVNTFSLDMELAGRVVPAGCKVEIMGPKVEITLKKADGSSWTELGNSLTNEMEAE